MSRSRACSLVVSIGFSLAALFLASVAAAVVLNGVETGESALQPQVATPTFQNFDPPCTFSSTLPLMGVPYMDPATQAVVIDGEGAVLHECSNFQVTGYSPPNFLAWNCNSRNADGTRPWLPLEIKFSRAVSGVSLKVASFNSAGANVVLRVFNAAHLQIGAVATALTPAAKTLSLVQTGIRYMRLEGPCIMIADDLTITY